MIVRSNKFETVLAAVAVIMLCTSTASAQSSSKGFGSTLTRELLQRNSADWHNSKNVRSRLNQNSVSRDRFTPRNPPPQRNTASRQPKPFSTIQRGPTVSPYLALSNPRGQVSDYFNIIRPQREQARLNQQQQRVNQQLLRQNLANQHRLNEIAAQGPYSSKGSENFAPTGHAAVHSNMFGNYQNTAGYFPPPSEPKDK